MVCNLYLTRRPRSAIGKFGKIPDFLRKRRRSKRAAPIIYSPWGKWSGAHFNPAVTLTFWRLGKAHGADAFFYIISQFIGAVIGVMLSAVILQNTLTHPSVNYVVTLPGSKGVAVAFIAEAIISFIQMTMTLNMTNRTNIARYTGLFAGALVATYISVESPLSGMSMQLRGMQSTRQFGGD